MVPLPAPRSQRAGCEHRATSGNLPSFTRPLIPSLACSGVCLPLAPCALWGAGRICRRWTPTPGRPYLKTCRLYFASGGYLKHTHCDHLTLQTLVPKFSAWIVATGQGEMRLVFNTGHGRCHPMSRTPGPHETAFRAAGGSGRRGGLH